MATYLLAVFKIDDPSWTDEYFTKVPAIVRKHRGEYLAVSERVRRREGDGPDPDGIALMAFPSMEAIEAFTTDPAYSPYRAARLAGSSGDLFAFTTQD